MTTSSTCNDSSPFAPSHRSPTLGLVLAGACLLPRMALADTTETDKKHHHPHHHGQEDHNDLTERDGRDSTSVENLQVIGHAHDYQELQPHLDRIRTSLINTPQTIIEVPKQVMADQNTVSMAQVLQTVPGVSIAAGEGAQQGDNLSIRGFNAQNDFYRDGMLDFGSYYRDPFDLETVEVLKGPSGALFGRGSTGGVINEVTKRADMMSRTEGSISFGTDGTQRATADVSRNWNVLGGTAVRINAMANQSNTAGVGYEHPRRYGIAPSLAFGLNTSTRLHIDEFWQQNYDSQSYGLPWLNGSPAPVKRSNYYGYQGDYQKADVSISTIRLEHDLSQNITIHDQFRYSYYQPRQRAVEAEILGYTPYVDVVPAGTPLSSIQVSRNVLALSGESNLIDNQTELAATFHTGALKHELMAGMEEQRQMADITRYNYLPRSKTSLLTPADDFPVPMAPTLRAVSGAVSTDYAPYINDQISWKKFQILGAYRFDDYTTNYHENLTRVNVGRTDKRSTFRTAFVYTPTDNSSVYFSYGTSFDPSGENVALTAATATLQPQLSHTYELGSKWNVHGLSISGALYKILMDNVRETNPNDATSMINAGTYRSQGFELSLAGHITRQLSVFGGYAYDDATVIKSPNPLELGNQPPNAPKHTLSMWSEYRFDSIPLELGAGVNYSSSRTASSYPVSGTTIIERAPGYVTAQIMAKYRINQHLTAQANLTNISNELYYAGLHPTHIVVGPGRAALFSLSAHY
nr:TonB-dependent siderophore receptor [uncultured Neokomagataea sp.]